MGAIPSLLYNPATVNTLQSLNGEGAASLLLRDSLQNVGIVHATEKEDPKLAQEVALIMWGSWLIWGGGSFLLQKLFYGATDNMGLPFAKDANSSMMKADQGVQKLTKENARGYAEVLKERFENAEDGLKQQAEKLAEDYLKIAEKDANGFMRHMNLTKLGAIAFSGGIPAVLTGIVLPKMAQNITKKRMREEAEARHANAQNMKALGQPTVRQRVTPTTLENGLNPRQNVSLHAQLQKAKALEAEAAVRQKGAGVQDDKTPEAAPRNAFWNGVNYLNNNMNVTNLLLVDTGVTGGRVASAEDPTDRWRWMIYEGIFLYMMYLGSDQVRSMIRQSVMGAPGLRQHAQLKEMQYPSLAILKKAVGKGEGENPLKPALSKSLSDLGIETAEKQKIMEAFETYTVHHSLQNTTQQKDAEDALKQAAEPVIQKIRIKMTENPKAYEMGDNMLMDLLIAEGALPVHRENFFSALKNGRPFSAKILGLDITQGIEALDGKGEKGVANLLYRMDQLARYESKDVSRMLNTAYFGHSMGIGASLLAGYLVMGQISPWVQSWLSNKVTGQRLPNRLNAQNYQPNAEGEIQLKAPETKPLTPTLNKPKPLKPASPEAKEKLNDTPSNKRPFSLQA